MVIMFKHPFNSLHRRQFWANDMQETIIQYNNLIAWKLSNLQKQFNFLHIGKFIYFVINFFRYKNNNCKINQNFAVFVNKFFGFDGLK